MKARIGVDKSASHHQSQDETFGTVDHRSPNTEPASYQMHEQQPACPGIFLDHDVPGAATGDAMFIGEIGKILRALNRNMNITALLFCPWTLKSIMLARCQSWCQLAFRLASHACVRLRWDSSRNRHKHNRFSLCCVSVQSAAKWAAGILSPPRMPFRHPGARGATLSYQKSYCKMAA
jgi:hypothetical protein